MNWVTSRRINLWREIAVIMLVLMDVSWITPWFRSLTPETYAVSSIRVLVILVVFVLFSYFLLKIMERLKLKKSIRQIVMVSFLVIGCFIGIKTLVYIHEPISLGVLFSKSLHNFTDLKNLIPVEFIIIITVLLAFWRGITLAQEQIGPSAVMSHFWVGIIMFVSFVILTTIVTGEQPGEFFFLFLFASLLGISSARMTVIGLLRGGHEVKFDRSWFLGIVTVALITTALAALIANILSHQYINMGTILLSMIGAIVIFAWIILNPVLSLLISGISKLINDSQVITELGKTLDNLNNMMRGLGQNLTDMIGKTGLSAFFMKLAPILRTIIFIIIIGLVIGGILLWIGFKFWKEKDRNNNKEEQFKIKPGNFLHNLLDLLNQGWKKTRGSVNQFIDFRHKQRLRAAARIRQIYAEILDLCDALDQPKPDSFTPLEFEPKIEKIFPIYQMEIESITQAYLRVRYGLLPETKSEVQLVEDAWQKILLAGQAKLKEKTQRNK